MPQKKAKPAADSKGKQKPKSGPATHASKPAKADASKGAKTALAKAATAPAVKKSPVVASATIKKPAVPVKAVATNAKPAAAKADMSKNAPKKAEPSKAAAPAPKPQAAKPALKAVSTPAAKPVAPSASAPAVAAKAAPAPQKAAVPSKPVAAPAAKAAPAAPAKPAVAQAVKPPVAAPFAPRPAVAPGAKAPIAAPVAAAAPSDPKKPVGARLGFKTGEWIVYPAQGVGRIVAIEEQEIAGMKLELFVITFEKDKMTLRVPTGKATTVGMRKLAEDGVVKRAMETLKGKARIKRTMWSRRAQEFEAKINSGDLVAVAEVVRDLYRAESQPEQSYSERLLFERALDRMAREIAAVDKLDERGAAQRIVEVLSKSAKARRPAGEETPPAAADDDSDEATAAA